MKKILVTGGAGFLGSHLCEKLLELDNYVICLDNYYTGRKENINKLIENKKFKFVYHDINEFYYEQVDEIYNLACPASPVHYQRNPVQTIKTCINGALNVLELVVKTNSKILQASTSEIYGDPKTESQNESYWGNVNPIGVRSCYDEGKRCAETLFFDYHRQYNILIKVVRIFNTYGPKMSINDGRVVSNFITQALQNKPLTIYGKGDQSRCFCYVDDLIDGLIRMMNTQDQTIGPINLGSDHIFSMNELADKIIKLTKSDSKKVYTKLPDDDPRSRKPNLELAKNKLNWKPKTNINKGLELTIDYFKSIFN